MITTGNHNGIMKYLKQPLLLWYLWTLGMCLKKDKNDPWLMKLNVSQQDEITMKILVENEQTTNTS